ncbi:hypothetical protein KJ656_11370, partial [bacterium]|nr:hypothetical protein [bacterium]
METIDISIDKRRHPKVKKGLTIRNILKQYNRDKPYLEYLAIKNNTFASLNERINENAVIGTIQNFHDSSRRAYENAAICILQYTVKKKLPERKLRVLHSMCDGV